MKRKKAITYWIMKGEEPLMAVRGEPMMDARAVKDLAMKHLDVAPGVYCPPGVTPLEMRARVCSGTVRMYE